MQDRRTTPSRVRVSGPTGDLARGRGNADRRGTTPSREVWQVHLGHERSKSDGWDITCDSTRTDRTAGRSVTMVPR